MAAEESVSPMTVLEDESDDIYNGIYHNPGSRNLSRLSVCTSSFTTNGSFDLYEESEAREEKGGGGGYASFCDGDDDADVGVEEAVGSYLSKLSVENFDADVEFSEGDEEEEEGEGPSSFGWCSMPATPQQGARRVRRGKGAYKKEYASENEAQKAKENKKKKKKKKKSGDGGGGGGSGSGGCGEGGSGRWGGQNCNYVGESECGGGGVVVITRAKGGKRQLRMDMEEVKACRELGLELELERERTIEIPGRISFSGSIDTGSSGGNSPISNWRISSPGDDPRDVKARLKVWAQMVALASSSLQSS